MTRVLVNIAGLPWGPERARNKALMLALLERGDFDHAVYVDSPYVWSQRRERPSSSRAPRRERVAPNLDVYEPYWGAPFAYRDGVSHALALALAADVRRRYVPRPGRYVTLLNEVELLKRRLAWGLKRGAELTVLDLSDDFTAFQRDGATQTDVDSAVRLADLVLCVNQHVADGIVHPNAHVLPNATDFENFQRSDPAYRLPPHLPKEDGKVYIGFTGGLVSDRVDVELTDALIQRYPDFEFLFIGYTNDPEFRDHLTRHPNAHFVSAVPFEELALVVKAFDVAIIPHAINEHTKGNDLLKVVEFMAAGIPVVATRCSNVDRYSDAIYVEDQREDFIARVGELGRGERNHDPAPGIEIARSNTWKHRAEAVSEWIANTLAQRR